MAEHEQEFSPASVMGKLTEAAITRLTAVNIQNRNNDEGTSFMLPVYYMEAALRDTIIAVGNESDKTTGVMDIAIDVIKESKIEPKKVISSIKISSGLDWNLFFLDLATAILNDEVDNRYPNLEKDTLDQIWRS